MDVSLMTEEQMELARRAVEAMERHAAAMESLAGIVQFGVIAPIVVVVLYFLFKHME